MNTPEIREAGEFKRWYIFFLGGGGGGGGDFFEILGGTYPLGGGTVSPIADLAHKLQHKQLYTFLFSCIYIS